MVSDPWTDPWWTRLVYWGLDILCYPLAILEALWFQYVEARPFVKGPVELAWQRCSEVWKEVGLVCQYAPYHHRVPFAHRLSAALARHHRGHRAFFVGKLLDPDPLLAAYAFKCLIRVCPLRQE